MPVRNTVWIMIGATVLGSGAVEAGGDSRSRSSRARCGCWEPARLAADACAFEAKSDFLLAKGRCLGLGDAEERDECVADARETYVESRSACDASRRARKLVCKELGEEPYAPEIDPADFVDVVDNSYFPLQRGRRWIYEEETDEGTERVEVVVTGDKREILGVECTVVRDTVTLGGELVEDTFDWFAQDRDGNVWYFGELSLSYADGELESLEGSWEAGVDGAQPGIVMPAEPEVGKLYRQEYFLGEAEDLARVLSLSETATVPAGNFTNCIKTEETTPIEPSALEHKFYAPGVGFVLAVHPRTGNLTRLVSMDR